MSLLAGVALHHRGGARDARLEGSQLASLGGKRDVGLRQERPQLTLGQQRTFDAQMQSPQFGVFGHRSHGSEDVSDAVFESAQRKGDRPRYLEPLSAAAHLSQ